MSDYYLLQAWTNDQKTTRLTSASGLKLVRSGSVHFNLNEPSTAEAEIFLTEPQAAAFDQETYVELSLGYTSPTLVFNGYLDALTQTDSEANSYQLQLHDSLAALQHWIDGGETDFMYPAYQNVGDILNGLHAPGVGGTPGNFGLLDHTNWTATYIGPGSPPGLGDNWRTDYQYKLTNIDALMSHYGLFYRAQVGSTARSGVLEYGALGDLNTLNIYGGESLRQQLLPTWPDLDHPNAAYAAQQGFTQITSAQRQRSTAKMMNVVWGIGHGSTNPLTIHSLFGDFLHRDGSIDTTKVTAYQPKTGGRIYYIKVGTKTSWRGNAFWMFATRRQSGGWDFGVLNKTSVDAIGIFDHPHIDHHATSAETLLSGCLADLENSGVGLDTWTMNIDYPMNDDNKAPILIYPGQVLNGVFYEGKVLDLNQFDSASGQWIPGGGPLSYMRFPTAVGDPGVPDSGTLTRLKTVMDSTLNFGGSQVSGSITLGKAKKTRKKSDDALARRMLRQGRPRASAHKYTEKTIDHVKFALVGGAYEDGSGHVNLPPGSLMVSEAANQDWFQDHRELAMTVELADANQATDIIIDKPVDGTLRSLNPTGGSGYGVYLVLRLAGTGSGKSSGFYTTTDGVTYTPRGGVNVNIPFMDSNRRLPLGVYRIGLTRTGKHYDATMTANGLAGTSVTTGVGSHYHFAKWSDQNITSGTTATNGPTWVSGTNVVKVTGAIGVHVIGGTGSVTVSQLHAHPHRHVVHKRRHQHAHQAGKHSWHNFTHLPIGYNSGTGIVTGYSLVNSSTASLKDDAGAVIPHEDGTPATFPAVSGDQPWTARLGDTVIYNASSSNVDDGHGGTVAPKTFGGVLAIDPANPTHDDVYIVGHLSTALTGSPALPWLSGAGSAGATAISNAHLRNVTIDASKIDNLNVVVQGAVSSATFTASQITDFNVTVDGRIANATIDASKIVNLTINTSQITDINTYVTGKISTATIDAGQIGTGTINAGRIGSATISTTALVDESVVRRKINEHNHGRLNHHNVRFRPFALGGTAGSYTTSLQVLRLATPAWIEVDKGTKYYVQADTFTGVAHDSWVVYDKSQSGATNPATGGHFAIVASGTDLSVAAYDTYLIAGRISSIPDSGSGQLWTEGWNVGLHLAGGDSIQDAAIKSSHIGSLVIKSTHIDNAQIKSNHIDTLQIKSTHIDNAQIKSNHIDTLQIKSTHIDALQIKSTHIDNAQIKSAHIDVLQIAASHIQDLTIDASKIAHLTITGAKVANTTLGKSKHDTNHPSKWHFETTTFTIAQLGGTYNGVALGANDAVVTWTQGTLLRGSGQLLTGITGSHATLGPTNNPGAINGATVAALRVTMGQLVIWNKTGVAQTLFSQGANITIPNNGLAAIDSQQIDDTNDAHDGFYIFGRLSVVVDVHGLPWFTGWNHGGHQVSPRHVQDKTVQGRHVGGGQINRTHVNTAAGQILTRGQLSQATGEQLVGGHIQDASQGRRKDDSTAHHSHQFQNCRFVMKGGTPTAPAATNTAFLVLEQTSTTPCYFTNDQNGAVALGPGTIVTAAAFSAASAGNGGSLGNLRVVMNPATGSFSLIPPTVNLHTDATYASYVKVGTVSHGVDPRTGNYTFTTAHPHNHAGHSKNYADRSIATPVIAYQDANGTPIWISAQDSISLVGGATTWTERVWNGGGNVAPGTPTGGNLTGITGLHVGGDTIIEVQAFGVDGNGGVRIGSTSYSLGWQRLAVWRRRLLSGFGNSALDPQGTIDVRSAGYVPGYLGGGGQYTITSTDGSATYVVTTFELLQDGTANVLYSYSASSGQASGSGGLRFRAMSGIKA